MVRFGLLGGSSVLEAHLRKTLDGVAVPVGSWPDLYTPLSTVEQLGPQVVLVNGTLEFDDALRAARSLAGRARFDLILLGDADSSDKLRAAMRAGCKEMLHPYKDAQRLVDVVNELAERAQGVGEGGAEVIAVVGCRGGVGVTTLCVGLGWLLSQDKRVAAVVVDVDQAGGDLLSAINARSGYTTADLLAAQGRLDLAKVRNAIVRKDAGFWVLPQPEEDIDTTTVTDREVGPLLDVLRRAFTHVVVDLGSSFGEAARQICQDAHRVVLVADQELVTLRTAVRRLKILKDLGLENEQVVIALNRYNGRRRPTREEIAGQLKHPVSATLNNDYDTTNAALDRGVSVFEVAARSELADDMRQLKALLLGEAMEKKSRGWWLRG